MTTDLIMRVNVRTTTITTTTRSLHLPKMPGRSTSGFHRPGSCEDGVHQEVAVGGTLLGPLVSAVVAPGGVSSIL